MVAETHNMVSLRFCLDGAQSLPDIEMGLMSKGTRIHNENECLLESRIYHLQIKHRTAQNAAPIKLNQNT